MSHEIKFDIEDNSKGISVTEIVTEVKNYENLKDALIQSNAEVAKDQITGGCIMTFSLSGVLGGVYLLADGSQRKDTTEIIAGLSLSATSIGSLIAWGLELSRQIQIGQAKVKYLQDKLDK